MLRSELNRLATSGSVAAASASGNGWLARTSFCAAKIFTGSGIDSNHFADADERRYRYFQACLQNGRVVLGGHRRSFFLPFMPYLFQFHRVRRFETEQPPLGSVNNRLISAAV